MSILRRLLAWLRSPAPAVPDATHPDRFSPRDWADLPVHHPRCE